MTIKLYNLHQNLFLWQYLLLLYHTAYLIVSTRSTFHIFTPLWSRSPTLMDHINQFSKSLASGWAQPMMNPGKTWDGGRREMLCLLTYHHWSSYGYWFHITLCTASLVLSVLGIVTMETWFLLQSLLFLWNPIFAKYSCENNPTSISFIIFSIPSFFLLGTRLAFLL